MVSVLFSTAAMVISVVLLFYLAVLAFQVATVAVGALTGGARASGGSFPALFQNLGIVVALFGALFRTTDLLVIGGLLIALAVLSKSGTSPDLHRNLEIALLVAALVGFGSLGVVYGVA